MPSDTGEHADMTGETGALDLDLARPPRDLVAVDGPAATGRDRVQRSDSLRLRTEFSRKIAEMRESRMLTPAELNEKRLIYPEMPNREAANAFREIRRKVMQFHGPGNFVTMVTSVISGGGASVVALNLAAAFAFDETKTAVVIDCNLENPRLADLLGMKPDKGLTDYLEDDTLDIADIIYPTGIPRLRLVPAGRRREASAEYFSSIRMEEFVASLKNRYPDRYLVLDAPPIGESVDANMLSDLVDCALIVAPYGGTTEEQITSAAFSIGKEKLAGLVFNEEPRIVL